MDSYAQLHYKRARPGLETNFKSSIPIDVVNQNEDGRSEREQIDKIAHEDRMKRRSKLL